MKEEKKLNMQKVKQVVLIGLGVILIGVGFINYNPEVDTSKQIAIVKNEDMIGDVELVSSNAIVENEKFSTSALVDNINNNIVSNNENVNVSQNTSNNDNYFENTKLERDAMYSKMIESYQKMLEKDNLAETQKGIAVSEISKITNNQNAIMIAENLIKNKGYEDAVVLVNEAAVNVVVKAVFLSNEDVVKIQNIIEREFNVGLENVNISNRN